jgi:hypothetical protein
MPFVEMFLPDGSALDLPLSFRAFEAGEPLSDLAGELTEAPAFAFGELARPPFLTLLGDLLIVALRFLAFGTSCRKQ